MSSVTGEVARIFSNDSGTFNVKMSDDEMYGFFKTKPNFKEGDTVTFSYSQRGKYRNADPKTVVVVAAPAAGQSATSSAGLSNQDIIRYQAARNSALTFLQLAAQTDAVKLPAKQAEKYDALMGLVHEVTDRFYQEANVCGTLDEPASWADSGAFDGEE